MARRKKPNSATLTNTKTNTAELKQPLFRIGHIKIIQTFPSKEEGKYLKDPVEYTTPFIEYEEMTIITYTSGEIAQIPNGNIPHTWEKTYFDTDQTDALKAIVPNLEPQPTQLDRHYDPFIED